MKNISTETQKDFDVSRYIGKWYEIAKIPFKWEKGCVFSSADYSWDNIKNVMKVQNNCLNANSKNIYSRSGEARIVDMNDKSKLKIIFNDGLPADPEGSYWVLYTDYDNYSIVSDGASGKYVWILSRRPKIPASDVPMLLSKVSSFGLNPDKLISNSSLLNK